MKLCTACGAEYGDEVLFCQRDGTPLRKSGAAGDLVGQVIADRYHIQKKLGEGGMGQVYLAEHVKMGRRCAIKIMSPASMSDPDAISRFNREAANASRISHPSVCAIYDFGETPDGLIYLAMEFIEGQSLTGLLQGAGTLPLARAAGIAAQCAEALQAAHELGIVHRDLKPDNIMVTTARGKDAVKVVDFGIAKAIGGEGQGQQVTRTGFVVGTPEYMSPEQLAGDPVDGRSDLYSLGLVFYRLLTGTTPFPADSQQETMIKRLTDDPLPLAAVRPEARFPAQVQSVVDRALARTPDSRYASAGDFAREVRALAAGQTGSVDVEAGTQMVSAGGAGATRQIPPTRVDPSSPRPPAPRTAVSAPPTVAASRTQPGRRLPVGAVVALLVTVGALGGGVFAFQQGLLGDGGGAPSAGDSASAATNTTAGAPGNAATPSPPPPGGGSGVTPSGEKPGGEAPVGRDSAIVPNQLRTVPGATTLPDLESIFDDTARPKARDSARAVYDNAAASDSLRADAASLVGQSYSEDGNFREAKIWHERAVQLFPREMHRNLLKAAETNITRTGGN